MPMDAVGQAKVIGFLETAAANKILNRHLEHGGGYDSVAALRPTLTSVKWNGDRWRRKARKTRFPPKYRQSWP